MRIGLLGGTFNPIHNGHLLIAEQTRHRLALNEVIFIPTGDPPHKPSHALAPAHHRLEMVRVATADKPGFRVSDIESRSTHTSYTFDTLKALRSEEPSETIFFFMVGLDAFLELPTWKRADELLSLSNFVVLSRPGTRFSDLASLSLFPETPAIKLKGLDEGTLDRVDIPLPSNTTLTLLALPPCPISASNIRDHLNKNLPLEDWLPPSVETYIIKNRLYKKPS